MKAPGGGGLNNGLEIRELRRMLAEACGDRTRGSDVSDGAGEGYGEMGHPLGAPEVCKGKVVQVKLTTVNADWEGDGYWNPHRRAATSGRTVGLSTLTSL